MADEKSTTPEHGKFAQTVKSSLENVKAKVVRIRRTDTQLFVLDIISPAAATLIAALAAAIGGNRMFVQVAAQSEDGGWKIACILAAVFGFIATISGMFKKQFDDRLTSGNQCLGRLLSLDLRITTGGANWEEAEKEYGEILKSFPDFVG